MLALFRNPLLRLFERTWWLPALTLILGGLALFGENGVRLAGLASAVYLAAVAGMIGAAWAHGALAAYRERERRVLMIHRFLCPHCLNFGQFLFACGGCGQQVESFVAHTKGIYVNDCPHCRQSLFSRDGAEGVGIKALCEHCQETSDRDTHHHRQVRVVATLFPSDHALLCQSLSPLKDKAAIGDSYVYDDGTTLTYILNLSRFAHATRILPLTHAFWEVEDIWIDASSDDPQKLSLELGEAVDQFIRRSELSESQQRALKAYVSEAALPPAARNVLESRFGKITYGVPANSLPHVVE